MTSLAQTVLILDELAATYRVELDTGDPVRWHKQLARFDISTVQEAVEFYQSTPTQFMPTVGVFASTCARLAVTFDGPDYDCPDCHGTRWVAGEQMSDPKGEMVYDTVKPCSACSPELLEVAREKVAEMRSVRARSGGDRLLPYRLSEKLNEARDALHKHDDGSGPTEDGERA